MIVSSVGLAWLGEQSELDIALADPNVLLAPAAMSMAFAAGMAAMAFQRDLRRYRFGWRQLVPFVAVVAGVASVGAGLARRGFCGTHPSDHGSQIVVCLQTFVDELAEHGIAKTGPPGAVQLLGLLRSACLPALG